MAFFHYIVPHATARFNYSIPSLWAVSASGLSTQSVKLQQHRQDTQLFFGVYVYYIMLI